MPSSPPPPPPVGIDVGGTFTDFVQVTNEGLQVHKEPTTAPQHRAVDAGLTALAVASHAPIVHGTTVATNALLERNGARTALVTTEGTADVLAIGRQNRPALYDLQPSRPPPLVPKARRHEVPERLDAAGAVVTPLDEAAARRVAQTLVEQEVESVAVVFLHAYRNPEHEARVAAILRDDGLDAPITLSSELLPEYREYERTATTVVNAYVRPPVERYLSQLGDTVGRRSLRVMQSNGGTISPEVAGEEAARLALSGPAGGVVGALGVARRALDTDRPRLMTLDMGGTSADVALCDGDVPRTAEHEIAGVPLRLPSVDLHTVGAGGGSMARVDAGGSLRVGPQSAGAEPGPVCYGRGGTAPTVTDAHVVLGRLQPDRLLGGSDTLDAAPDAAHDAVAALGEEVGLSPEEAALGILRVATARMERALRRISIERGYDPRNYTLVPFGGAGPLHGPALAAALGIKHLLVPPSPGVLSALGLLMADVVYDTSRAVLADASGLAADPGPLRNAAAAAEQEVHTVLDEREDLTVTWELDLRYAGQSYELSVPAATPFDAQAVHNATEAFHERHRQRYGHANPEEPVKVVALRARGSITTDPLSLPREPETNRPRADAQIGTRPVWFDAEGPIDTPTYRRADLHHGHALDGPAVLQQYDTTIVVPPDWHAHVDGKRNVWMER